MLYKFNTHLSEKDYLDFNIFTLLKSHYGKKQLLSLRILIAVITLILSIISLYGGGFTLSSFLGIIPLLILMTVFEILLNPFFKLTIKSQLRSMYKKGKCPTRPWR